MTDEQKQAEIVAQEMDELAWRVYFSAERKNFIMDSQGNWIHKQMFKPRATAGESQ